MVSIRSALSVTGRYSITGTRMLPNVAFIFPTEVACSVQLCNARPTERTGSPCYSNGITRFKRDASVYSRSPVSLRLLRPNISSLFTVSHGENFVAIFTTLSVVIWFSTGTLGIFATLLYVFTTRVVIYDILSMAIIPTLSTSILFCNLCYILL